MPERERQDILRQIESHIYEALEAKASGKEAGLSDIEAVLSEMDPPDSYGTPSKVGFWRPSKGQVALLISLGSLFMAGIFMLPTGRIHGMPFLLICGGQIAAFIIGIRSRREPCGKAAIYTSVALAVIAVLSCP